MSNDLLSPQNVLQILEIASILLGGITVAFKLGRTTNRIEASMDILTQKTDQQGREMVDLKSEIKKLNVILTTLAVQETRLDMHEKWIDELRRGIGVIHNGSKSGVTS